MTGVTIINFSHPLTEPQLADLAGELRGDIARVIDVPTHFDPRQPYAPQTEALVAGAGLAPREWQTLPLAVNLPSFNAIAALVLARLHGLMGHFPAIIRLRPVEGSVPTTFELAEIIDLNAQRIRAAQAGRDPDNRDAQ